MSKIIVIAKVPHHIEVMEEVIAEKGLDIPLFYAPDSERCFDIAAREINNGTKIIICSDYLYHHYFDTLDARIIPIIRSPFLFAKAISSALKADPRSIVISRSDAKSFTASIKEAASLLGAQDCVKYANSIEEVDIILEALEKQGKGIPVVSPVWAHDAVIRHGFEPVKLPFAKRDFENCVNQAVSELTLIEEKENFSQLFKRVLDFITVGILHFDPKGIITAVNRTASEHFPGLDDAVGKSCSQCALDDLYSLALESTENEAVEKLISVSGVSTKATVMPQYVGKQINAYIATLSPVEMILADERKLRRSINTGDNMAKLEYSDILGISPQILKAKRLAKRFAEADSTILIKGPTGCGKEVFAQSIHNLSDRRDQPFVAINCAALPESLLESILFGYDKGSFTGAQREGKRGLFEAAHKGTIFLDEISEMPMNMQARFLRVIQEREVMRLGSTKPIPIDVRIVAATNRDLLSMVEEKTFRQDLYYRISVLVLEIPALAQRREDIPLLSYGFIKRRSHELGCPGIRISNEAINYISSLELKGNVRELNNILERCIILSDRKLIDLATVKSSIDASQENDSNESTAVASASEKERIKEALRKFSGNRQKTAEALDISTATLWRKMKKYDLFKE